MEDNVTSPQHCHAAGNVTSVSSLCGMSLMLGAVEAEAQIESDKSEDLECMRDSKPDQKK